MSAARKSSGSRAEVLEAITAEVLRQLERAPTSRRGEPDIDRVVDWIAEVKGRGATDALRHFWPEVATDPSIKGPGARRKLAARIRQRMRARGVSAATAEGSSDEAVEPAPKYQPIQPDLAGARLPRAQLLELQLARVLSTIRELEQLPPQERRNLGPLTKQVADLSAELDAERKRSGTVVLDRSPAAVAAEVLRRQRALEILAAAHIDETDE